MIQYPCPESDAVILARPFLKSRYADERIPDQDRNQDWEEMISAEWRAFAVGRVTIRDCLNPWLGCITGLRHLGVKECCDRDTPRYSGEIIVGADE
jgi:hypothetical protein